MRENVLNAADDAARDFIYYGRKEDEELPVGEIQKSVERGDVSVDEIVAKFRERLEDWW